MTVDIIEKRSSWSPRAKGRKPHVHPVRTEVKELIHCEPLHGFHEGSLSKGSHTSEKEHEPLYPNLTAAQMKIRYPDPEQTQDTFSLSDRMALHTIRYHAENQLGRKKSELGFHKNMSSLSEHHPYNKNLFSQNQDDTVTTVTRSSDAGGCGDVAGGGGSANLDRRATFSEDYSDKKHNKNSPNDDHANDGSGSCMSPRSSSAKPTQRCHQSPRSEAQKTRAAPEARPAAGKDFYAGTHSRHRRGPTGDIFHPFQVARGKTYSNQDNQETKICQEIMRYEKMARKEQLGYTSDSSSNCSGC